jgi:hypothetical protein
MCCRKAAYYLGARPPFPFPRDGHQAPKGNNILTLTKETTQDLKSFNAGSPVSEKTCFTQFMKLDNTPTSTAVVIMVEPVCRTHRALRTADFLPRTSFCQRSLAERASCFHEHSRTNGFDRRYKQRRNLYAQTPIKGF